MIVWFFVREKNGSSTEPGIQLPTMTAARTATTPNADAWAMPPPFRTLVMYHPMARPIGIVQAIVKVPHELPGTSSNDPGGRSIALVSSAFADHSAGVSIKNASDRGVGGAEAV